MAVEARSLASLHALANNPPRDVPHPSLLDLQNPTATDEPAIVLYAAKIPNSKNLILTTVKPRQTLTEEDVDSYLYLACFDDVHAYQNRARSWEAFGRLARSMSSAPSGTTLRRKNLPESAKVHPALTRRSCSCSPESHMPKDAPTTVDYVYEYENQFKTMVQMAVPIPMSKVKNTSQKSLSSRKLIGPNDATITLIRADVENEGVHTVARILDPSANKHVGPANTGPAYVDITNDGYKSFGTTVTYTQPEGGTCFTRAVYFDNTIPTPKLIFMTPFNDFCQFEFIDRDLKCYRVVKAHESRGVSGVPVKVLVSSMLFNMNSQAAIQRETRPPSERRQSRMSTGRRASMFLNFSSNDDRDEPKKSNRLSAWLKRQRAASSIPDDNGFKMFRRNTSEAGVGSRDAEPPSRSSQMSSRRASVASIQALKQGLATLTGQEYVPDEPADGSFDLYGIDGTAKLGKLLVFPAGLPFLDLLVSANMMAFCRMYELILSEKKARMMEG